MVVEPYKETTLSAVTMEWTTPDSSFGDGPVGYWGNSRPTWADHAIKDSDTAIGTLDDSRWGHDPDGGKGRTRYYYGTDCCQRGDDDDDGSGSGGRHNRGRGGGGDDDGSGGGGRQDDDSSGRKWPCRCGSWRRKSSWVLTRLDDEGTPIPDAPPLLNITLDVDDDQDGGEGYYGGGGALSGGGERIDGPTITLTEGGTQYLLVVTEMFEDGEVIGEGRATVSCRYVRRELRELTTGDRDAFMDAMVEFYTAPTVVTAGGPDDRNYQYFAAVHDAKVRECARTHYLVYVEANIFF